MSADLRRYHLYTRNPRRPGIEVIAATGVPEASRGDVARAAGVPVIFADIIDIERAATDIRDAQGEPLDLPDAAMAAYRLFLARDEVPLKRLRFMVPSGEVQVQGEYFRSHDNSQIWREAQPPTIQALETPDLGQALGALMSVGREEILGASWVDPGGEPVVVILMASYDALKRARVGTGARAWVRAHEQVSGEAFRVALMSPDGPNPLSDGYISLLDTDFEPMGVDGTAAACAMVAHWHRTPRQLALTAEVGDGARVLGRVSVWIEGPAGAPERLSIAGHVRGGESVTLP